MNKKEIKYALVLSGGGFNGAFQLGALNYLKENWQTITGKNAPMKFDLIAGVSTGALNGAMVAMNRLKELNDLWVNRIGKNGVSEVYNSAFIDTSHDGDELKFQPNIRKILKQLIPDFKIEVSFREKCTMLISKKKRTQILNRILSEVGGQIKRNISNFKSIADNSPLRLKLHSLLKRENIQKTKFYCGFVSLDTGEYHNVSHDSFSTNHDFVNGVLASTSMPMVWKPVQTINFVRDEQKITSRNNVDGGIRNVSPLGDLIHEINSDKAATYRIIIINCHNNSLSPKSFDNANIGELTGRSVYEIAFNEIFRNDIQHFTEVNGLIEQSKAWDSEIALFNHLKEEITAFDSVIINPRPEVDLGNALVANKELINHRMRHGYATARFAFEFKTESSWK